MNNHLLHHLIAHVIMKLNDMGVGFGKTKLVKLLYLMDVENYRIRRTTISGLEWRFYHYGPYAFEIDGTLRDLQLDIPQDSVITETGHKATVFRSNHGLRPRLIEHLPSPRELRIVNTVIRDWGGTELNPLLNHVYFYTEPMEHAKRGDVLDFSKVQRRRSTRAASHEISMPSGRLDKFRSRFQEAKSKRVRRSLDPVPRFDNVYEAGLARITSEEATGIVAGPVDVPDEVKEYLRDNQDGEVSG